MGRLVIPDKVVSNEQMHALMMFVNEKLIQKDEVTCWKYIFVCGMFFMLLYGCSLRGQEGLLSESSNVMTMFWIGKGGNEDKSGNIKLEGHVCPPLPGQFKTETGKQKICDDNDQS